MSGLQITGKHTTADVKTDEVDETFVEQVQRMVDHEAFQNPVKIMPDGHAGAGAVIGFTMRLGDRICPNTVGVDIGCGMSALNLGNLATYELGDKIAHKSVDGDLRREIPMGRNTFGDTDVEQSYHIVEDFPWGLCEEKRVSINRHWDGWPIDSPANGYGKEYLMDLCERVGYDVTRAINSIGTLGGGNHFVEIARSEQTGDYWAVVHSGSRGIGLSIAKYWQELAHQACDERADEVRRRLADVPDEHYKFDLGDVSDRDLLNWVQGGMGEDWKDTDYLREAYDGEDIGDAVSELQAIAQYVRENADGSDLDYLERAERHGYLVDMIFAQTYAAESRRQMLHAIADVFGIDPDGRETIVSTHNYIDFEDLVIRKGATRVHDGERGIIPFNMRDGSIIVRGKGNDEWNQSAPHGAGRRGSRRWAFDTFEMDAFTDAMDGIFSTSVTEETLDEAPFAYKDKSVILERIEETAAVEEILTPVHNLKAEE